MIKHGYSTRKNRHPIYTAYLHMKQRCLNKRDKWYLYYGGRGIKICKRWLGEKGFIHFLKDMGNKPSNRYSLGRINNDGDYKPSNCRWETRFEQQCNRRTYSKSGIKYLKKTKYGTWRIELTFDTKEKALKMLRKLK